MRSVVLLLALVLGAGAAGAADTWWNKDWTGRTKIVLDTSATGVEIKAPLANVPVLVRLDTARFEFARAKPGGTDIRFVASDDKTPLKYFIESYDDINELASIWVQVPQLSPGRADGFIWLYFGNDKIGAAGDDARNTYDLNHVAVFQFAERDGQFRDATANAIAVAESGAAAQPAGWVGGAASFSGKPLTLTAVPALRLAPTQGFTFSAWVNPQEAAGTLYRQGAFEIALDAGQLLARVGNQRVSGGAVRPGTWQHVAVAAAQGAATVFVDGAAVASGTLTLPDVQANVEIGATLRGDLDGLHLSNVARGAEWIRLAALGASPQANFVRIEAAAVADSGGHASYFKVLIDNLTLDAWIVIVILMVMLVIALVVMWMKAQLLARSSRANDQFREHFDTLGLNIVQLMRAPAGFEVVPAVAGTADLQKNSALYRMYQTAIRELANRARTGGTAIERTGLSEQALQSIRASVDATMVRERQRLDSKLVLLTIAISGGPFLGLLGTVVGVMIVFAAVAAAGDVNINAIAPGIAAALLATVAGLGVAIPCLFGYNYLASRVKSIAADMQVFADEITTRLAERFAPTVPYALEATG
jgi:biopolymer transport protein ExbB